MKALVAALLLVSGCGTPRHRYYWHADDGSTPQTIQSLLQRNPLAPTDNIRVVSLGRTAEASHHLVQVRHAEPLHIHAHHDLTVFVERGHGVMRVGGQNLAVAPGDTFYLPRGVPHAFTNHSRRPAVAIVVFTPAFDGKDTVAVSGTE